MQAELNMQSVGCHDVKAVWNLKRITYDVIIKLKNKIKQYKIKRV